MRRRVLRLYIKKQKNGEMTFSLAWNIMFIDNWKVLVLNFLEMKDVVLLIQKVDANMIFTDYWNVLVLIFSEMGNTVFFLAKKLMEKWYLLITESSCFKFSVMENTVFFSQKVEGKMIFTHSFWVFQDIPGLWRYGFSCSGRDYRSEFCLK